MAALAGAAALTGTSLFFAPSAAAAPALTSHTVLVTVVSVTPSTPPASTTPQPIKVQLLLANTTDQRLDKLTIQGDRGNPISTQAALDQAIAKPQPPDPTQVGTFSTEQPVTVSLTPRASTTVTYASTTDTIPNDAGMCICQNRIYPLYFTVHTTDDTGTDVVVGSAQSYVPAFGESPPKPVRVSWVWPIIDRPHRLTSDAVFTDDTLATSVEGGRLDRVLQVVESVGKLATMTLVIDPELIDELAVMSAGPYRYESDRTLAAGTGTPAATKWLARLRLALAANPKIEVDFTPPADPDIESLTRNGLAWTSEPSDAALPRVTAALGGYPVSSQVAWPADGGFSTGTLNTVVRLGAHTVILSDAALRGVKRDSTRIGLASLQTPAGSVLAAITTGNIQRYVAPVISRDGTGSADLPKLVSEVAIRAIEDGTTSHYVVIVAPRMIDPSETAVQAIRDTSRAFWSTSLALSAATPPTVQPADHGELVVPDAGAARLAPQTVTAAQDLVRVVPALTTMLTPADADILLGSLPAAVQRTESTGWRTDPASAARFATRLSQQIEAIKAGVHILKPSSGTYTLASSNSPLPLTIKNDLNVPVSVRVRVVTANGLPGFSANDPGLLTVAPGASLPLHLPTHLGRTGRFAVQATLYTPDGNVQLGTPVMLLVHSTALGAIGVIITIAAAAVLVLALVIRMIRRLRNPKAAPGTAPPVIAP